MFSTKDYSKLTLDELVLDEKKLKSYKITIALVAGFMVGVAIWSATHKWRAFFTFGLLILPFLVGFTYSKSLDRIKAEISRRGY